jgi:hypothetical protein
MYAHLLKATLCASMAAGGALAATMSSPAMVATSQAGVVHAVADDEIVTVRGVISDVDFEKNRFVLEREHEEQLTIRIDENTRYTLNGEASTKEEVLKAGAEATVSHESRRAISLAVRTES